MFRSSLKIIIYAALILSSTSCSDSTTVEGYLTQAEESQLDNDPNSAVIALKNAIRLEPKNAYVRFKLGSIYLAQGDYINAEKELERSEDLGGNEDTLYALLAEVKLKLYKLNEIYLLVDKAVKIPNNELIKVLTIAGIAALQEDNKSKAVDYIDRAIGISESSKYSQLGSLYLSTQNEANYVESINAVTKLLLEEPKFTEAILLKGYLLQNNGEFDRAADTFVQYSHLRPKEIQVKSLIAQNYISAQKYDLAEPEVDFFLKIIKESPIANQQKAQIEYHRNDFGKAKEHAEIALQQIEELTLSRVIAGVSAYKLTDYEQAYQHLVKVQDKIAYDQVLSGLLLDLQIRLGYDTEVLNQLRTKSKVGAVDAHLLTSASQQFFQSGDVEAAEELLDMSIQLHSENPDEIANQGWLKFELNQTQEGIKLLEKALSIEPTSIEIEERLASGYLLENQYDKAYEIAIKWQRNEETEVKGLILESIIMHSKELFIDAKEILNKALNIEPTNVAVLYRLGLYASTGGDTKSAYTYFTKAILIEPKHSGIIRNLLKLLSEDNNLIDDTIELFSEQLKNEDNNYLKSALSLIYRIEKDHQKSIELFKQILKSNEPIHGVRTALAESYKLLGNLNEAIKVYENYILENPKDLIAINSLVTTYEQINRTDKALEVVERALKHQAKNSALLLTKAYYQSILRIEMNKSDAEALNANEEIKRSWLFDKIQGNFAYNEKDFIKAARFYQNAYLNKATTLNVINWSKSVGLAGDIVSAINILEQHLKEVEPTSIGVNVMLAGAYLKNDDSEKAYLQYKKVLNIDNRNTVSLNNLAILELQRNKIKEALEFAKRAVEISPNNPGIIDTYAQALLGNNQTELALQEFDKALAIAKGNAAISINKAKALIKNNKMANAKQTLLNVNNMNNFEETEIKQLLLKIENK